MGIERQTAVHLLSETMCMDRGSDGASKDRAARCDGVGMDRQGRSEEVFGGEEGRVGCVHHQSSNRIPRPEEEGEEGEGDAGNDDDAPPRRSLVGKDPCSSAAAAASSSSFFFSLSLHKSTPLQ